MNKNIQKMMEEYQYDYGGGVAEKSQDNFEVEFIDNYDKNKNDFEPATEWSVGTTTENEDSFSFMDFFGRGEFDVNGSIDNLPPEFTLTPFPLRVIVAVLIPVGMLINISSLCHCRRISSPFLSLGFYIVALANMGILTALSASVAIPTFSEYYRLYWLPYFGDYATASATCLTVLANYTLLAMTIERMANAHNYMQKLGCCCQLVLFGFEILIILFTGCYALPWFASINNGGHSFLFVTPSMQSVLYSRFWVLLLARVAPLLLSIFVIIWAAIKAASINRNYKIVPQQERRQTSAIKWTVAFWTLISIPLIVLACLEVAKQFDFLWEDENELLLDASRPYHAYSALGRVRLVCVPCAIVGSTAFAALSMMLKFTC